jgi:hypothetical protein
MIRTSINVYKSKENEMKRNLVLSFTLVLGLVAVTATAPNSIASTSKLSPGTYMTTTTAAKIPSEAATEIVTKFVGSPVQGKDGSPKKKSIIGSWMETVTLSVPGNPSFKSLNTFTADGGLIVADQGNVNLGANTLYSAGHGSWVALEGRTVAWTILELVADLNGNPMGLLKVSGRYTVDESGNSYSGNFKAEQVDVVGNLVFSVEGTNEGHRIDVEPLP